MSGARVSPKQFQERLAASADALRRRIEAEVSGFSTDRKEREARLKAVNDPANGFRFFAETYFPHYLTMAPNRLHLHLFAMLPKIAERKEGKGARDVVMAPRGSAKSTLITQIFLLYLMALKKRRYMVIVMDVYEQAALMLAGLKVELEENPRLLQDFPECCGQGRLWRENEIVTTNGAKIDALGARQKIRGRRHGPKRPDFIVLDDIENDDNVKSPEYREKLFNWVMKAVLKAGAPDGSSDVLVIGTLLRRDAVLSRIAKAPGWTSQSFRALVQLPDDMKLWDAWEELYVNDMEDEAEAFYQRHKAAMDTGAVVNWPEMQPLLFLMKERAESPTAFASEYQNDPVAENAPFQDLRFFVQQQRDWIYFGAVDPSLGKTARGRDPSAILIGGLDRVSGVLHVVDASIRRRLPDVICEDVIAKQREWNCVVWFVETVQFQEFLRTEVMARAARVGVPLPAMAVTPITDKRLRIERLQPPTAAGLILFRPNQNTLLEQMRHWPDGEHDDGPDCLEMLWSNALKYGLGSLNAGQIASGRMSISDTALSGYRL